MGTTSIGCSGCLDNGPRAVEQGHVQTLTGPTGESPVSLLFPGDLAEPKDYAWPLGGGVGKAGSLSVGQSPWSPQHWTGHQRRPPHREQLNFSSANSRLVAPTKLQVRSCPGKSLCFTQEAMVSSPVMCVPHQLKCLMAEYAFYR